MTHVILEEGVCEMRRPADSRVSPRILLVLAVLVLASCQMAYYAAMDVFMLPTLREGFGVAFCEAMSMQIPVVATRIAPLTDVVTDALTGFLADAGDAEGFAAAAERLIVSPALRVTMGQAGRLRVVEHFSVQRMVREHESLFDSLTSGRDHG